MWPPLQLSEWTDSCRPLPSICAEPPSILFPTAFLLSALFTGLPSCLCVFSDSHIVTDVHTSSRLEHLTCLLSSIFHPANELTLGLFRSVSPPGLHLCVPKYFFWQQHISTLTLCPTPTLFISTLAQPWGRVSFAVNCCDPAKRTVWGNTYPTYRYHVCCYALQILDTGRFVK